MTSSPSTLLRALSLLVLVLLCSACAPSSVREAETPPPDPVKVPQAAAPAPAPTPAPPDKAQQEMTTGIGSYENGSYKLASKQLQNALVLGLRAPVDQSRAHKYLAFMHCVGKRINQCRDEFRKALNADPAFDLTPAEAGHPTWGPVFRKLKAAGKPAAK